MTIDAPPSAIELAPQALTLRWGGPESVLSAALLRARCRCAPCQSARLRGEAPAPTDGVTLVDALPVGHYALQLVFSDGHDRGIYPWAFLKELAAG